MEDYTEYDVLVVVRGDWLPGDGEITAGWGGVTVPGEVDPHVQHVVADVDLVLRPVHPVLLEVAVPEEPQLVRVRDPVLSCLQSIGVQVSVCFEKVKIKLTFF